MITYNTNPAWPGLKFPVLHKVVYDLRPSENVPAKFQRSYKDYRVDEWLKENCRSPYYHSPGYMYEKFIQFECDEEAMMFALKWGV